jgi:glucose/arabinose dehydrogenase
VSTGQDSRPVHARLLIAILVFAAFLGPTAPRSAPQTVRLAPARQIHVPAGFRAEVYASGLERPTALAWSPRDRLYVTQETGKVVSVSPGSRRPRVEAGGFSTPLGLVWARGALYVSAQGTLWRISGGRRHVVLGNLPFGEHQQDNVVLSPDGRLYLGSGSTCDACTERSRLSAAVLSVRPDGTDLRVVARGLRNPYGLAFDRGGRLYASVNNLDKVPSPAETIVVVRSGRFYGWPRCWANAQLRRLVGSCSGVTQPVAFLEPHSSADGLVAYRGDAFGAAYQGNLFVALWGEYLHHRHGRRVERVVLDPSGDPLHARVGAFATGFDHPLAVTVDAEGALLVADWGRGVIYRIQAAGRP